MKTDCLIIGAGLAGLTAAYRLAKKGFDVVVLSSGPDQTITNSHYAQGGIAYQSSEKNDPSLFEEDILKAGHFQNNPLAVKQLVSHGPKMIQDFLIKELEVPFEKDNKGNYLRTQEAAHSEERILYKGDYTGRVVLESLYEKLQSEKKVQILYSHTAVNLLLSGYHPQDPTVKYQHSYCYGAFAFDQKKQEVFSISAQKTILATGGVGSLYLHHTNGPFSRGDGIALAFRAGCRVMNLNDVQFHPTTFYRENKSRFLISEAVRGEGGILLNERGERFVSHYLKGYAIPELAPRDRVAQAIHQEMFSHGDPCVYLDISSQPKHWLMNRFPKIYQFCLDQKIDITKEPIPVVPAAHYHCGGVWTDLQGQTSVPGLYAIGEVGCTGVHGINRLASTSLLECLVMADRCSESITQEKSKITIPETPEWQAEKTPVDQALVQQDWMTLKHTMWNYVGLTRTAERLNRAQRVLSGLAQEVDMFYRQASLSDSLIGLRHACLVAQKILASSQRQQESCHLTD